MPLFKNVTKFSLGRHLERLFEKQILSPYLKLNDSESLGMRPWQFSFLPVPPGDCPAKNPNLVILLNVLSELYIIVLLCLSLESLLAYKFLVGG